MPGRQRRTVLSDHSDLDPRQDAAGTLPPPIHEIVMVQQ
jgi:hypothetical protein